MSTDRHNRPQKTRQTILRFRTLSFKSATPVPQGDLSSRKPVTPKNAHPVPFLPNEIWQQVFELLGNLDLKTARLICRQWLPLCTEPLFKTIYLNPFEKSWSNLISISQSPYARLVQCVAWDSLFLDKESLDVNVWYSNYHNILRGLPHYEVVQFYEAYQLVQSGLEALYRSTSLRTAARALNCLENCSRAWVSDNHCLESFCADVSVRYRVQSRPELMHQAATWGLLLDRTEMADLQRDHEIAAKYENMLRLEIDFFATLLESVRLTNVSFDYWDEHLACIETMGRGLGKQVGNRRSHVIDHPKIITVNIRARFPDRERWKDGIGGSSSCLHAFHFSRLFSSVQNLYFEASLDHPSRGPLLHAGISDSLSDTDDCIVEDQYAKDCKCLWKSPDKVSKYTWDNWKYLWNKPNELSESVWNVMCCMTWLGLQSFTSLKLLTLSNISFDMSGLLCFLSSQQQSPTYPLYLHLRGTVVIYNLEPLIFLHTLKQMNVLISYNVANTFFTSRTATSSGYWNQLLSFAISSKGPRHGFYPLSNKGPRLLEEAQKPLNRMPPCPSFDEQNQYAATTDTEHVRRQFCHPFSVLQQSLSAVSDDPMLIRCYRLCRHGSNFSWEWVRQEDAMDIDTQLPQEGTFPLFTATTYGISDH